MYFEKVDASSYYDKRVKEFLKQYFSEIGIGKQGSIDWPTRTPDLKPMYYVLTRNLEFKVNAN